MDFLERMLDEYANLYYMKNKLERWILKNVDNGYSEEYLDKCYEQFTAMDIYCKALKQRIELVKRDKHVKNPRGL